MVPWCSILYFWPGLRQTLGCCLSPICATVRVNTGSLPPAPPYLKIHRAKPVTHSKHMLNIQFSPAGLKDGADPSEGAELEHKLSQSQQHVRDTTTMSRLFVNRLSPFNRPRATNPRRRRKKKELSFTNCQHAE